LTFDSRKSEKVVGKRVEYRPGAVDWVEIFPDHTKISSKKTANEELKPETVGRLTMAVYHSAP
jgi:hypothetical protein